jgi:superfamily I DNA and/or RNA helicase
MNATSSNKINPSDQSLKILEFWHKIEFFIPFDLQQQVLETRGAEHSIHYLTQSVLNKKSLESIWQSDIPIGRELSGFDLFLGLFDKSDLTTIGNQIINSKLSPIEEEIERIEQIERADIEGATCFARIKLNTKGEPLFSEVSVSTAPWAMGAVEQQGLNGISVDAFQSGLKGLQERLQNFNTQRLNRRLQQTTDCDSAGISIKESSAHPLSGDDIQALLEIFYNWAGYNPVATEIVKNAEALIRVKTRTAKKVVSKSSNDSTKTSPSAQSNQINLNPENSVEDEESAESQDTEIDILNSFYTQDIERAINALKAGKNNTSLSAYLTSIEEKKRIDLYTPQGHQFVLDSLNPRSLNSGHWPDEPDHVMSLMQQFAIGQVVNSLGEGEVFSVNGPPGTGKTTLLRDIFADNITKRARVLAGYDKVSDSFEATKLKVNFSGEKTSSEILQLKTELTGYEMLVTSSNNAAVENISRDLPKTESLGPNTWCSKDNGSSLFGYLQPVAHKLSAQNNKGEFDSLSYKDTPWGLISCALGNQSNRKRFIERLCFPGANPAKPYPYGLGEPYPKEFSPEKHQSIWTWRASYMGPSFAIAKNKFLEADDAVRRRIGSLQELTKLHLELRDQSQESFTQEATRNLSEALQIVKEKKFICDSLNSQLKFLESQLQNSKSLESLIKKQRPGWISCLLRRPSFKNYEQELSTNYATQSEQLKIKIKLEAELNIAKHNLDLANTASKKAHTTVSELQQIWLKKKTELESLEEEFPEAKYPEKSDDLENEHWQKIGIWGDNKLNKLRSELFLSSLQLHEAWLAEVTRKGGGFSQNIIAFCNFLDGKRLQETEHSLAIWQSLFMVVPVISSTFASIANQFRNVDGNSFGWLFIDEAGQSVPQAAVGALWRCKRAVIVGDPIQIEPVFTVPIKLIEALFESSGLPNGLKVMPHKVSAQNIADSANRLGTSVDVGGASQWIGSPLRVHRRCVYPMFEIANAIAYDNKMVYGLNKRSPPDNSINLGISAWVDIKGTTNFKQVVSSQIDLVFNAFASLYESQKTLPPLYIISPFKQVKMELIAAISDIDRWSANEKSPSKTELTSWCKQSIGTVHTFQGKENSIVWMVLGCDDKTQGAIAWASSKPNLLNVALTRAKHRFFIIGDKNIWADKPYFSTASVELETSTPEDFLDNIRKLIE